MINCLVNCKILKSSSVWTAKSACPPSEGYGSYYPLTLTKYASPNPVPGPTTAIWPCGYGLTVDEPIYWYSDGFRLATPYPAAIKSLIMMNLSKLFSFLITSPSI